MKQCLALLLALLMLTASFATADEIPDESSILPQWLVETTPAGKPTGIASGDYQRCSQEFSAGTTLHLTPSRPNDYLGLGFGIFKGADTATSSLVNEYEKVLECMYRVQLNQYFYLAPYFQLINDPAYRDTDYASATGIQAGFVF